MSLITPLTFTGVSKLSSDLQTILTRSQQIAQLPLTALSQDQLEVQDQQTALKSVQVYVGQVYKYLAAVQDAAGSEGLSPSSSSSKITVSAGSGMEAGQHIITNVTQLAKSTATATATAYATAESTAVTGGTGYLELWVGGERKTWSLAAGEDNLNTIRDWINTADLGVTASIISADAGYALSVSANAPGATTIELFTGADRAGVNLLTTVSAGADLSFTIDGQTVQRTSNAVNDVIPGLQLNFTETTSGTEEVTVAVKRTTAPLKVALAGLTATYNALQTELSKHVGKAGGVLTGDTAVNELRTALSSLGSLVSLQGSGLSFDENGVLQYDASAVDNLSDLERNNLLGSLNSANGVAGQFAARWEGLADATTGLIGTELTQLNRTSLRLTTQISNLSDRINSSQERLKAQLQVADALLARLESQQGMLTATLDSLSYVAFGKTITKSSS